MPSLTDITLTAAERKALAVVIEHSEIRRKSVSAAYDALEDEFAQIVPTRQRLASFEDDWSSPDMEVYDD